MTGLVLVPGLLVVLVAGAVPSVYAAVEPSPSTSWAGSRAGEGQERPGRQDAGLADPEAEDAYVAAEESAAEPDDPEATIAPEPSRNAALPGTGTTEESVLQALALGSGLVLMGLGLGLAFVGLRIRRG